MFWKFIISGSVFKNGRENKSMWYIYSKNGLRGVETYTSEMDAWRAADLRNMLVNQGWHPMRVA